ncbi:hypothetical protein AB7C87_14785 [Natrarchaeobius sp. A-rgal3]|uniref:hypothetical protein n=1 Tax=Natrarchaeobius versutus TaxID=1679078 RepID=UPI00351059AF
MPTQDNGGGGDERGNRGNEHVDRLAAAADEKRIRGQVGYDMHIEGDPILLDAFLEVFEDEFVLERTESPDRLLIPYDDNEGSSHDDRLGRVAIVDCIHDTLGTDVFHGAWFTALGRS